MKRNSWNLVAVLLWVGTHEAFAGSVTEWPNKIMNVLSPMGIVMSGVGFAIVGLAHSSMFGSDWARQKEKLAFRGALFSIGGTAMVNLMQTLFR